MSLQMLGSLDTAWHVLGIDGDTSPKDAYAQAVETEFLAMKSLADRAKWPADLSPRIKAADAAWQSAKSTANAAKQSVVHAVGPALDLPAKSRESINVGNTVQTFKVSTVVSADKPVVAERAVYFNR